MLSAVLSIYKKNKSSYFLALATKCLWIFIFEALFDCYL